MIKPKNILLFIAKENFNNHEYTTIRNSLLKKNCNVSISSDAYSFCKSDSGKIVQPDIRLENINPNNFDAFVIIGGYGIINYLENNLLKEKIKAFRESKKILGAICAAPYLLKDIEGIKLSVHPEIKDKLRGEILSGLNITTGNGVITATGPEYAEQFASGLYQLLDKN